MNEATTSVKTQAAELGFDACFIAEAGPIGNPGFFDEWLAKGCHADMDWLVRSRDVRVDVRDKMPAAQSMVVVARNYYSERPAPSPGSGRVSRYAWGRDYHRTLRKPLKNLAGYIEALGDAIETYCCIDSGPLLERYWAAKSGLGWIGKNSLVLRKDIGSWFFLGVIVTSLKLAPDSPAVDHCGSCTRCMDACPTGAIIEPGMVDSRKCISYHTIENRGAVPEAVVSCSADWVFGCDICQEVCPWNGKTPPTSEKDFHPRPGHANPDLTKLGQMAEEDFLSEFAGMPIMRAKCQGMKRNARNALRNQ